MAQILVNKKSANTDLRLLILIDTFLYLNFKIAFEVNI